MKEGSERLLAKAERAIRAARTLLDAGDAEFAAGRGYYAMFYVAEALLYDRDLWFGKHSAVHAAYGKEFAKTGLLDRRFHRWLLGAFNLRLQMDYSFDVAISPEEVEEILEQARAFLTAARQFLTAPGAYEVSPAAPGADGDSPEATAKATDEEQAEPDEEATAEDSREVRSRESP